MTNFDRLRFMDKDKFAEIIYKISNELSNADQLKIWLGVENNKEELEHE